MSKKELRASKKGRLALTAAFCMAVLTSSVTLAKDDSAGGRPLHTKQAEQLVRKQFLREHSDASGTPRPDMWRHGIEQQKQMQVAPYIGWHPKSSKTTTASDKH